MITRNRIYGKRDPSKDAHKIYVICEGESDEPRYFGFFEGLSSNLNVITIPSKEGRTDPQKLSEMASGLFDAETGHFSLDYTQGDRVWFVIDTDAWEKEGKIEELREFCSARNEEIFQPQTEVKAYSVWNVAQSNPSFEIWLYYHFYADSPKSEEVEKAASFKHFVDGRINGGFNYNTDPVRLKDAIVNAEDNYAVTEQGLLALYSTELSILGREINGFVSAELAKLYNKLK